MRSSGGRERVDGGVASGVSTPAFGGVRGVCGEAAGGVARLNAPQVSPQRGRASGQMPNANLSRDSIDEKCGDSDMSLGDIDKCRLSINVAESRPTTSDSDVGARRHCAQTCGMRPDTRVCAARPRTDGGAPKPHPSLVKPHSAHLFASA